MSERKRKDVRLSKSLRKYAAKSAPVEMQDVNAMAEGDPGLSYHDLITEQIVKAASRGERWAIEIYADRTEGKPGQAIKEEGGDRTVEESLDELTRQQLNDLARRAGTNGVRPDAGDAGKPNPKPDGDDPDPGESGPASARGILDLPEDGDHDSEDA